MKPRSEATCLLYLIVLCIILAALMQVMGQGYLP